MKNILIIGGTRNIGYLLSKHIIQAGHQLTILNRGVTPDDLPDGVHRLRCDRTDPQQLKRALNNRQFDMVIDMTLYHAAEADQIAEILRGQVGHYIAVSSGQVYLVREGIQRPFREQDYAGALTPQPTPNTYDHEEWLYGMNKREMEDALFAKHDHEQFPVTTLRLPMVNSEYDHFRRLYGYILRVKDGDPILVPDTPNHPLRHIYGQDVVTAIIKLFETGAGKGQAFNISQDETLMLDEFLKILAKLLNKPLNIVNVPRKTLEEQGFLPDCSPFSDLWMSELDNTLSKQTFGMIYTPVETYLANIVNYYQQNSIDPPISYRRRGAEKQLAQTL
jgi:nucleoside-diphosphate-sugar epimerase